jgi:FSR family fosmidomycin resistance protein-like MFS transporter
VDPVRPIRGHGSRSFEKYNETSAFLFMAHDSETLSTPAGLAVAEGRRSSFATLSLYSIAHFTVDVYSSALGVFQPVLARSHGLFLTQAGILGGTMVFSGSVLQPAYGYLSDRFHSRMFTVLAPAVAGLFISSIGLAPGFGWILLMVFLGAAGVASFHPQASARAALDLMQARGKAMAVFISAGALGFAIGPAYFSMVLNRLGLERAHWAAVPGVMVTLWLLVSLTEPARPAGHQARGTDWSELARIWRPLLLLYLLVFLRSVVQISFTQFLPLYLTKERDFSLSGASLALSLYSTMGALGGFAGGHIADRFGGRRVIQFSMIGCIPFLLLFFWGSGAWALIGLALGGLVLLATNPVNIVMAQELAPGQSGTVSALMMGFAWGMAGMIFIPLAGLAADHFTLHRVLESFVVFPFIGFLLALRLPK